MAWRTCEESSSATARSSSMSNRRDPKHCFQAALDIVLCRGPGGDADAHGGTSLPHGRACPTCAVRLYARGVGATRGLSSRRPLARRSFAEALPCVNPRSDSLDVRKPRIVGPPAFTVQRNGLRSETGCKETLRGAHTPRPGGRRPERYVTPGSADPPPRRSRVRTQLLALLLVFRSGSLGV